MKVAIEKNELVIRVPVEEPRPSSSGKNMLVATDRGTFPEVKVSGRPLTVAINAYFKP